MAVTLSNIVPASTHLSGNPIEVKATTSGIPAGATDYKILLKIVSSHNVLFGSPFIDAIAPDASGEAMFDISGYVNQGVERDIEWPIASKFSGRVHSHEHGSYTIRLYAGERYIDANGDLHEIIPGTATVEPVFIVNGKIPYWYQAALNDAGETWWDRYCQGGQFFSYMPAEQVVTPFQPVKLWWIPPTTNLPVQVKVKYYHGNVSQTIVIYSGELWYDYLFEIDCHPEGNAIPIETSNGLLNKYEVWIESAGTVICAKRTFIVSWKPPVEKYWYLFVDNRMGGVECISLTGRAVYEPKGERTLVNVPFERGGGAKTATTLAKATLRTRKWKINSGIKAKPELEAMDFLLDTTRAWLAIPPQDGDTSIWKYTLAPVIIENNNLVLGNDMDPVGSIDIELTEAR